MNFSPAIESFEQLFQCDFVEPEIQALPSTSLLSADILRLDLIHPLLSGNKSYKLLNNILVARKQGAKRLLSFGGPYSNHLHALAAAGNFLGIPTIGMVRGYEHLPLTHTLTDCRQMGMDLHFLDRKTYPLRYEASYQKELAEHFKAYVVPEGGNNQLGIEGAGLIADYAADYDEIWLAVGSGCTYQGLAQKLNVKQHLVGVMSLKGATELEKLLRSADSQCSKTIESDFHCGGFGKQSVELQTLMAEMVKKGLPLDPVYTSKMVLAFLANEAAGKLDQNRRYLLIHSGGLQGAR